MTNEKILEKYYEGKLLLGKDWDSPLIDKILLTLQTCTTEEINPIDRASWFGIIYRELRKIPPVEIDQPIYRIYSIDSKVYPHKYYITYGYVSSIRQDKDKKWGVSDTHTGSQAKMITHFILKSEIKVKKISICMK